MLLTLNSNLGSRKVFEHKIQFNGPVLNKKKLIGFGKVYGKIYKEIDFYRKELAILEFSETGIIEKYKLSNLDGSNNLVLDFSIKKFGQNPIEYLCVNESKMSDNYLNMPQVLDGIELNLFHRVCSFLGNEMYHYFGFEHEMKNGLMVSESTLKENYKNKLQQIIKYQSFENQLKSHPIEDLFNQTIENGWNSERVNDFFKK